MTDAPSIPEVPKPTRKLVFIWLLGHGIIALVQWRRRKKLPAAAGDQSSAISSEP